MEYILSVMFFIMSHILKIYDAMLVFISFFDFSPHVQKNCECS